MNFRIKRVVASVKAASVLCEMYTGQPVTIKEISEKSGLSDSYLEQIFTLFRKAKIVRSIRGPGGGYHLKKMDLTVSDIARAVCSVSTNEYFHPVLTALESVPVSVFFIPGDERKD